MDTALLIWLWAAFLVGLGLRITDRIEHAVRGPNPVITTTATYFRAQYGRFIFRILAGAVLFQAALEIGEVTTKLAAMLFGYGVDTALDSFLERRARKNGTEKNGT